MRFDKQISFQRVTPGAYQDNGDYAEDTVVEVSTWANITAAGENTMQLLYGNIRQNALVVRIQGYAGIFDYILIGGKRYKVDRRLTLERTETFVVSEVQ